MRLRYRASVLALLLWATAPDGLHAEPTGPEIFDVYVVESVSREPIPQAEVALRRTTDRGSTTTYPRTTDETGRARFERVPAGNYSLEAKAERHVSVFKDDVDVTASPPPLHIQMDQGIPFDGMVRTESGEAVAYARVLVRAGGVFQGVVERKPGHGPYASVTADREGRFHVPGIPKGAIATVFVRAKGHEELRTAVREADGRVDPGPLALVLRPGGRIAGVVVAPDGRPVPEASVFLIPADAESLKNDPRVGIQRGDWGDGCLDTAPTDRKGRFAVDGLALDRPYLACAYAPGFSRSDWSGPHVVAEPAGKVRVQLTLRAEETSGGGDR